MATVVELKKNFQKLADSDNLSHGYIFFGHESAAEKIAFANELANFLETKKWAVGERPLSDALIMDAGQDDGGIDVVRAASRFLWQKPAVSAKRTLVINSADALTVPAQNAILKIAEEPPKSALIILLVKDPEGLLPAVHSRFQKIFLATSDKRQATSELAVKFLKASAAKRKEMLKELLDAEADLEPFVAGLISELRRDKIKNWKAIKELLRRWSLIRQFNLNKKLQLEAVMHLL